MKIRRKGKHNWCVSEKEKHSKYESWVLFQEHGQKMMIDRSVEGSSTMLSRNQVESLCHWLEEWLKNTQKVVKK